MNTKFELGETIMTSFGVGRVTGYTVVEDGETVYRVQLPLGLLNVTEDRLEKIVPTTKFAVGQKVKSPKWGVSGTVAEVYRADKRASRVYSVLSAYGYITLDDSELEADE